MQKYGVGSPNPTASKHADEGTAKELFSRTVIYRPPNEDRLRGIIPGPEPRTCEVCGQAFDAYLDSDTLCDDCIEGRARHDERAHALARLLEICRVQRVEDLPPGALATHQRRWGRSV